VQPIKAQSDSPRSAGVRTWRPRPGWPVLLLVGTLLVAVALPPALAQRKKGGRKKTAGKQPAAKKTTPKPKATPKPKKTEVTKSKKTSVDMLADLKRLPSMNINKPLLTKPEYDQLGKAMPEPRVAAVLQGGRGGFAANKKFISDWAKWRILGMTRAENRDKLFDMKQRTLYFTRMTGKKLLDPTAARAFRKDVFQLIVDRCEQILDNNYFVRLQAVMILGNLNQDEFNREKKLPPVAFGPAYKPLLKVLLTPDKEQPLSIKIAAAVGLKRIALLGPREKSAQRTRELEMVDVLIKEFQRQKTHSWYQMRLAEAMAALEMKTNVEEQAVILQALTKAVVNLDHSRAPSVRAQAAMSLGRAALPTDANVDLMMHEIVNLAAELSEQYNADLAKGSLPSHWTDSFLRLYFAFMPVDRLEKEFLYKNRSDLRDRNAGLLGKGRTKPQNDRIKAAYQQVLQVVKHVAGQSDKVKKAPVPVATIAEMRTWMASHPPKDFKIQGNGRLPALRAKQVGLSKSKRVNGGVGGP